MAKNQIDLAIEQIVSEYEGLRNRAVQDPQTKLGTETLEISDAAARFKKMSSGERANVSKQIGMEKTMELVRHLQGK